MKEEQPVVLIDDKDVTRSATAGSKAKGAKVLLGKDADDVRSSDVPNECHEPLAAEVTG